MDTVKLLNSYRMAVTRDREAVRVLAFLHRDGPLDEVALAARISSKPFALRTKLTDLYRANLVTLLDASRYGTTELAEQVLAHLGIGDVVAREAIARAELPDDDRVFLMSCVARSEGEPVRWRRYLAAAVRSASELTKHANLSQDAALRTWYAAVAGLDPVTHELGPETFIHYIAGHPRFKNSMSDSSFGRLVFQCKRAVVDRAASNEFLTRDHIPNEADTTAVLALSVIRLLASVTSQTLDDGVAAAINTTGFSETAVNRLAAWCAPFERTMPKVAWTLDRRAAPQKLLIHYLISRLPNASSTHNWNRGGISRDELRAAALQSDVGFLPHLRQLERRAASERLSAADAVESLQIVERLRNHLLGVIGGDVARKKPPTG